MSKKRQPSARFVKLEHWMMRTAAWQSLNTVARCAYVELASRYAGSNNGRIPYSMLEMAQALHVSKATAQRALMLLQERGFIVACKRSAFSVKCTVATEWRLTEYACDITHALATKEFSRWQPEKKQNTVSPQNATGTVTSLHGFRDETVKPPDVPVRFHQETDSGFPRSHQSTTSNLPRMGGVGTAVPQTVALPAATATPPSPPSPAPRRDTPEMTPKMDEVPDIPEFLRRIPLKATPVFDKSDDDAALFLAQE